MIDENPPPGRRAFGQYGLPLTAELDRTGEDYSTATTALVGCAVEEAAVRNLQSGLSRTIRRLRVLEQVVIPGIEHQRRAVAVAVEEDERDDTVRYRQADALGRTS